MLCKENKYTKLLYRFYSAEYAYIATCLAVAVLGVIFGIEVFASCILILLVTGQLAVLRESAKMFYPLLLVISMMMKLTGSGISEGWVLLFFIIPFFAAFFYNIKAQGKRFRWNPVFLPMIAVSVAISIGGLFSISPADHFDISNMFYVVFLGFGMVGVCAIIYTLWDREDVDVLRAEFIRAIAHSGIFVGFIVLYFYVQNFSEFLRTFRVVEALSHNPFRNVAVSYFILAMPFVFFCSRKRPVYFFGGLFLFIACIMSGSRMGLLFGCAEFFICILYYIAMSGKRRKLYSIILGIVIVIALIFADDVIMLYLGRDGLGRGFFRSNESRVELMYRAMRDFKSNPIFGTGLGFRGNEDCYTPRFLEMHWYHNFVCQIMGSLGLVGIAAYLYQYYVRLKLLLCRSSSFGWVVCLMYLGVLMTSLTDTGIFTPFPTMLLLNCAFMLIAKQQAIIRSIKPKLK